MKYIDAQIPELVARARNGEHIVEDEDGLAIAVVRWANSLGPDESEHGKVAYERVATMMAWERLTEWLRGAGEGKPSRDDWREIVKLRNDYQAALQLVQDPRDADVQWALTELRGRVFAAYRWLVTLAGGKDDAGGRADAATTPADVAALARETEISLPAAYAAKEAIEVGQKQGLKFNRIELKDLTWWGIYEDEAAGEVELRLDDATAYLRQLDAEGELRIPVMAGQVWCLADGRRIRIDVKLGDENDGYWRAFVLGTDKHLVVHERFLSEVGTNRLELHEIVPTFAAERIQREGLDVTVVTPAANGPLSGSSRAKLLDFAERARDELREEVARNPGTSCTFAGCDREDDDVGLWHVERGLDIDVLLCPEHRELVSQQLEATEGQPNGKAVQITMGEHGPVTRIIEDPTLA